MKYDAYLIDILNDANRSILTSRVKFVSLEVGYKLARFPSLRLILFSIDKLDMTTTTDLKIKIQLSNNNKTYNFNLGILNVEISGGQYIISGINLPHIHLEKVYTRKLSDNLKSSLSMLNIPYEVEFKENLQIPFIQLNETNINCAYYLLSGVIANSPAIITDRSIDLLTRYKKETILVSDQIGSIVIRNKFLKENIVITESKDFIQYQGKDESFIIKISNRSDFYKNRLINAQYERNLRIRVDLTFNISPQKIVGDKVILPDIYKNLVFTIVSSIETFTESGISTVIVLGCENNE